MISALNSVENVGQKVFGIIDETFRLGLKWCSRDKSVAVYSSKTVTCLPGDSSQQWNEISEIFLSHKPLSFILAMKQ
jgi:hypothetical protein